MDYVVDKPSWESQLKNPILEVDQFYEKFKENQCFG